MGSFRAGVKAQKDKPLIDLSGERFGKLFVIRQGERKSGRIAWECKCDCGNVVNVIGKTLRNGSTTSCGCARREVSSRKATKHNMCGSKLYYAYWNMKKRCYNKKSDHYKWYGNEGKVICDEWLGEGGFERFADWSLMNGYDDSLTIDRIDNSKGYSPDNCRWVTPKQNCRNKRNNHLITINGVTKSLIEWSEEYGISDSVVRGRIRIGWSDEDAITTPMKRREKHG